MAGGTFRSEKEIATTGLAVLRALLGAYQTAAASVANPSYRMLYASLGASVSQQVGTLAARAETPASNRFPLPWISKPRATRSRPTWVRRTT